MPRGSLANLDIDAALADVASGILSKEIAAKYGCTPRAVRYALERAKPEEYKAAVADQAQSIVEDSMQYLREVKESGAVELVPIARACADVAFKYAAARDPARWGRQDQAQPVQIAVIVAHGTAQSAERLLQSLHTATQQTTIAPEPVLVNDINDLQDET
jgi:hypothetical protein